MGRPSLGAWATYGLGTENQNMPAFVVMPDPSGMGEGRRRPGATATPASYQGTILRGGDSPILNLNTPKGVSDGQQRATVDFINQVNRENLAAGDEDSELAARISAYERCACSSTPRGRRHFREKRSDAPAVRSR